MKELYIDAQHFYGYTTPLLNNMKKAIAMQTLDTLLDILKDLYNNSGKSHPLSFSHIDTGSREPLAVFNQGSKTISFNRIELNQIPSTNADIDKAKYGIKESSIARFLEIATSMNKIQAKEYGSDIILKGVAYRSIGEEKVSLSRQEIARISPQIKDTLKERYPCFFDTQNGLPSNEIPAYRTMISNFKLLEHITDSLHTDDMQKEKRSKIIFNLK